MIKLSLAGAALLLLSSCGGEKKKTNDIEGFLKDTQKKIEKSDAKKDIEKAAKSLEKEMKDAAEKLEKKSK